MWTSVVRELSDTQCIAYWINQESKFTILIDKDGTLHDLSSIYYCFNPNYILKYGSEAANELIHNCPHQAREKLNTCVNPDILDMLVDSNYY